MKDFFNTTENEASTHKFAIEVDKVSKLFKLPHEKHNSIKSLVVGVFRKRRKGYEMQKALNNISFDIKRGEFFGIVGRNGSGKSTLLKMLAGIYVPSKGTITVNGKLTPFIELGVGFNPELTGRENVFLNGALLGFNRKEMSELYHEIVEFAELERFMDQKLKNYSSGMQVRLAFSIAIQAKSDILLIDEVLAVGDALFQKKCFEYFAKLKEQKRTVVFVSHDRNSLDRFCDRGILIDNGKHVTTGSIKKVIRAYDEILRDQIDHAAQKSEDQDLPKGETSENRKPKPQTKKAKISTVITKNNTGERTKVFEYGEQIEVSFRVKINSTLVNPILGITIHDVLRGASVFAYNTAIDEQQKTGTYKKGDSISFALPLPLGLNDSEYSIEPAIADENGGIVFDQIPDAMRFTIVGSNNPYSLLSATSHIKLNKQS